MLMKESYNRNPGLTLGLTHLPPSNRVMSELKV